MSHNPAPDWYDRYQAGETCTSIAKTARKSRNRVTAAIREYRARLDKQEPAPAQRKPAPARHQALQGQTPGRRARSPVPVR